ncbi:uncharacterized protein LOC132201417 [Neocloeon triangulifer]|uniref:uncharacterized protein LOC132201417 n=1 Tax=Neocloeon triangulifer TaxID=2078957 RepID=UPI00286F6F59|nr:uncharacterized protein LOC132201417 [Neocloeon triangulifer]XP_059483559.1 uncharacterized protein LOC132201417 [Neocloeon triangulifer]
MNGDFMFPPPEETVRPGDYAIVTWDLETTDRHFDDLVCQIGAFCLGHNPFNQYVLPAKSINHEAAGKIHLQVVVHEGRRVLIDTVSRQILDSVDERLALQRFMAWLYTTKGNHTGVVLISHSTIKLDVPVLLQALTRHKLEGKFFEIVIGFGDSFGPFSMEMRGQFPVLSLQSLYTAIVGPRTEQHDAASDAEAVYRLLETAFGSPLTLNIPQIQRYCYTPRVMAYYVEWKRRLIEKSKYMKPLVAHINNWKVAGGIKWDLLTIGYDYATLGFRYQTLGEERFIAELRYQMHWKKQNDVCYLTHTSEIDAETIVQGVVQHFRNVSADRMPMPQPVYQFQVAN